MEKEEKVKRVTITLDGELLKWLDRKIKEKTFHNYQHAVEYALTKVYDEEPPRFEHFNVYEDHVTVWDGWKRRLIDIYFKNGRAYCELDQDFDCEHIRFALSLPKVVEILRERGWKIEDGKIIRGPP